MRIKKTATKMASIFSYNDLWLYNAMKLPSPKPSQRKGLHTILQRDLANFLTPNDLETQYLKKKYVEQIDVFTELWPFMPILICVHSMHAVACVFVCVSAKVTIGVLSILEFNLQCNNWNNNFYTLIIVPTRHRLKLLRNLATLLANKLLASLCVA